MPGIDTEWFHRQLDLRSQSVRGLARFLGVDPSAVSRMLKGERKMSADEQDKIAAFLGIGVEEVAARRRGEPLGFSESKQEPYLAGIGAPKDEPPMKMFREADIIHKDGKRWMEGPDGILLELHPAFGCMAGTMTIPDDLDLTAPIDVEWSDKLYNE
jgi:transcriptional regulator with XRE-family HTH domain